MKLIEINEENLAKFLNDIRLEDEEELERIFKDNYKKCFLDIAFELKNDKNSYFLADENDAPIAIGGAYQIQSDKKKIGQIWLLSARKSYKRRFFLYKYVKNKISFFKKEFDILFNYIYKSNFDALKWLKNFGFRTQDLENPDFKMFYFDKGENKN